MTNKNSTKRSLFSSVVAIMLCCTMLLGTTFAWFTDEASTGRNTSQAGNLDMKVSYKPYNSAQDWTEVDSTTPVFSDQTLYEPGYTEAVWLEIKNEGSLAFRSELGIDIYSEKELSYLLFRGRISHHMQVREIIDKAKKAFGETDISEEEAKEKYGLLSRYCYTNESYEDVVKENHNLRVWSVKLGMNEAEYDGYIWCCYSQEGMNEEGVTITGSKTVPVLWCLEQDEQGTWDVAEIKEMP